MIQQKAIPSNYWTEPTANSPDIQKSDAKFLRVVKDIDPVESWVSFDDLEVGDHIKGCKRLGNENRRYTVVYKSNGNVAVVNNSSGNITSIAVNVLAKCYEKKVK